MTNHQIRQCTNEACRLRFPMPPDAHGGERCPHCRAQTVIVAEVNAPSEIASSEIASPAVTPERLPMAAFLDNVRSLFNVGSIFRSADGAGFQQLHLGGITPTPAHPKLAKTALGAEQSLAWHYHRNGVDAIAELRSQGMMIWALEEDPAAESLFAESLFVDLPTTQPLLLVVGNEVTGVDPGILKQCDRIVAIPMQGVKRSLNVATAFGVAAVILSQRWQERHRQ